MNPEMYIQIPNSIWDIHNELTKKDVFPELLYLYSHILVMKNYSYSNKDHSVTITSINMISTMIKLLSNDRHPEQNKKKIKSILLRLRELSLIHFDGGGIGYGDLLCIRIKNIQEGDFQGYQKIHAHIFESCSPSLDSESCAVQYDKYAILCYIKKCEGYKDAISYQEMASKIGRSHPYTVRVISNMEVSGLIHVVHGKYYVNEDEKYRQEKNRYKFVSNERQRQIDEWNDSEAKLQLPNFVYALRYKDEDTKLWSIVERRIEKISSSPSGEKYIKDMFEKARAKIEIEQESA